MHPRFRKIAVFAGAAVLAGGVGVAVASQGGDETSSSRAALTQGVPGESGQGAMPSQDGRPDGGGPGMLDLDTLAGELGVSTDELQNAVQDLQPEPPTQDGANPLVTALATALGLSEDKVAAALEAVRPQGAPGGTPPAGAAPGGSGTTPPGGSQGSDHGPTTEATLS